MTAPLPALRASGGKEGPAACMRKEWKNNKGEASTIDRSLSRRTSRPLDAKCRKDMVEQEWSFDGPDHGDTYGQHARLVA